MQSNLIPGHVNGVSFQTVLTVCERTYTLGRPIVRKPVMVNMLEIMGVAFTHEVHDFVRNYGEVQSKNKHFLRGERWEFVLVLARQFPGNLSSYNFNRVTGQTTRETLPVPADWLRWGKEAMFTAVDHRFTGDEEAFAKAMLYARMLGGESAEWEEVCDLLN